MEGQQQPPRSRDADKEAELEARMARIRAANEARERRHAEVQADKKQAEAAHSAVKMKADEEGAESEIRSFVGEERDARRTTPGAAAGTGVKARLVGTGVETAAGARARTSRLSEKDKGPPPDPGYNFLADRMRDASDDEDSGRPGANRDYERPPQQRPSPRGGIMDGASRGRGYGRGLADRALSDRGLPAGGRAQARLLSQRQAPLSRPVDTVPPPRREVSVPRYPSPRAEPARSTAQSRLDRNRQAYPSKPVGVTSPLSRGGRLEDERAPEAWVCPDPSCNYQNMAGTGQCRNCRMAWFTAHNLIAGSLRPKPDEGYKRDETSVPPRFRQQQHPQQESKDEWRGAPAVGAWQAMPQAPDPTAPSWTPAGMAQTADPGVVIGHWQEQTQQPQQQSVQDPWMANNWREGSAGSWADEVEELEAAGMSQVPTAAPVTQWIPAAAAPAAPPQAAFSIPPPPAPAAPPPVDVGYMAHQHHHYPPADHTQMGLISYPSAEAAYIPAGPPPVQPQTPIATIPPLHQISPQQVHNVAAALTQITATPPNHHSVPIMSTHDHQQYNPPRHFQQNYYSPTPRYTGIYNNGDSHNSSPYVPPRGRGEPYRPRNGSYRPRLSDGPPISIRQPPEREITKIPLKFQKQSTKAPNTYSQRKAIKERNLPKATTSHAPATARRLTIFGTSNVVNNLSEAQLSKDLGVPVRLIPAMKLDAFQEKIELVDPALDRFVLVHGLGNDARNLANKMGADGKTPKKDLEKAQEADDISSAFCEIVKDLVERIPYLDVAISTLLPRFDQEHEAYMSCPNNVRKVMNVEISMRLEGLANVRVINNDEWSSWGQDDDVKRNRLFGSDGYHLTPYGFSLMLDFWMKSLRTIVTEADLPPSPGEDDQGGDDDVIGQVSHKLQSSGIADSPPPAAVSQNSEGVAAVSRNSGDAFHDALEGDVDPKDCPLVDDDDEDSEDNEPEITEKENEEKMEKEL